MLITWGDGLVPATTTLDLPVGQFAFSTTRRYVDDPGGGATSGAFPISIAVKDKDGGSGSTSTAVTVANVPPTARLVGSFDETSGELTIHPLVTDPGMRDTFTYNWQATKDGEVVATGTGPTFSFAPESNKTYIVSLAVTDNSGGVGTTSAIIVIGTPDPDLITIDPFGASQVTITNNGTLFGPFTASVVTVFGKERNDTIRADPALTVPLELHGGSGDDTLVGAQGNDTHLRWDWLRFDPGRLRRRCDGRRAR